MVLVQTLERPVHGYWDGGAKQVFEWSIQGRPQKDKDGKYVKIGSWSANLWFHVSVGKTEKATLANARRKLQAITKIPSTFEYRED